MYQNPTPVLPVLGAAVVLPNTGGNELLLIASIATIVIGVAVMATTAVRMAARKAYKA